MSLPFDGPRDELGEMILKEVAIILDTFIHMPPEVGVDIPITKFHALRTPSISLDDYLARISKFSGCSNECFIMSLIYIDRLVKRRRVRVDGFNIHRLLITSVMIAAKFFDDHYYDNRHYSQVGGVPKEEMNLLELEFLFLLEFNLYVDQREYDNFRTVLYRRIGLSAASAFQDPYNNNSTAYLDAVSPEYAPMQPQPQQQPSKLVGSSSSSNGSKQHPQAWQSRPRMDGGNSHNAYA